MRLIAAAFSVIIITLLFGACHDSTGPEASFAVSVTLASSSSSFIDTDTSSQISCDVTLRAVATGQGRAAWGDATFRFFAGPDRATPLDSVVFPATDIRDSWGGTDIDPSRERQSQWRFTSAIPFGISFVFTYLKNGAIKRLAPVAFTCGPTIPAIVPPPILTVLGVSPPSGDIDYGDTLLVGFSAASQVGMWESDIDVTGACNLSKHFSEHLSTTVTHNVPIIIPPTCRHGGALFVKVRVLDSALRGLQASLATFTIHDRTPPDYNFSFGWKVAAGGPYIFAGDTMAIGIGVADNFALGKAFWEFTPQGLRDSLQMHEASWAQQVSVPIPGSWAGKTQLHVYVRDSIGNTSDTLATPAESLRVIPLVTHSLRESTVLPDLRTMVLDEPRGMVYAVHWNTHEILGVSLQSAIVTDTIILPSNGGDIDATVSGDTLVVGLPGQRAVGIVDLTVAPPVVTVVPLTSIADSVFPDLVRVAANGKAFLTVSGTPGAQSPQRVLVEVDLQTKTDRVRSDAGVSGVVGYATLERSLDHTMLLVNGIYGMQRYASASDAFGAGRIVTVPLYQPKIDGTGSRILIGTGLYDGAFNLERHFETPSQYESVPAVLTPDGGTVYQAFYPTGIIRNGAANGGFVDRTRIPFQSLGILMSRDGNTLVMHDNQFNKIAVMDLQ